MHAANPPGVEQPFRHYGLAVDMYTHFTSPIRRWVHVSVRVVSVTLRLGSDTLHVAHLRAGLCSGGIAHATVVCVFVR